MIEEDFNKNKWIEDYKQKWKQNKKNQIQKNKMHKNIKFSNNKIKDNKFMLIDTGDKEFQ